MTKPAITFLSLLIFIINSPASLAKIDRKIAKADPNYVLPEPPAMALTTEFTEKQINDTIAYIKENVNRTTASDDIDGEKLLSKEFKEFRDKLDKVTTAQGFEALIKEYNETYDTLPTDLKLVIAHMTSWKSLKSFLPRVRTYFEENDVKFAQSFLLSNVRILASVMKTQLPSSAKSPTYWDAVYNYIFKPNDGMGKLIQTDDELQHYFAVEFIPSFSKMIDRIAALDVKKPVVWDNKIVYGPASFQDGLSRYQLVGAVEKEALLSTYHTQMVSLMTSVAYNWTDALVISKELGYLFGFDSFSLPIPGLNNTVQGAPAKDRIPVIMKHKDFLTLNKSGAKWMSIAWKHFTLSVYHSKATWKGIEGKPKQGGFIVNPVFFNMFSQQNNLAIETLESFTKSGTTKVRSAVTGETADVKVNEFFKLPPPDLKAFLPNDFEGGQKEFVTMVNVKTAKGVEMKMPIKYRNYLEGRPSGWYLNAYKVYFPSVTDDASVPRHARIFSQAFGSTIIGSIFATSMY